MQIVVIGGTGLIGSKVVATLREQGHEAVASSPRLGVNTLTGEGLGKALNGASVVVDVSNAPSFEETAVLAFFETSTRTLLAAENARHDPREVVTDPRARYFGAELGERTLVPSNGALLGETHFADWLSQATTQQ